MRQRCWSSEEHSKAVRVKLCQPSFSPYQLDHEDANDTTTDSLMFTGLFWPLHIQSEQLERQRNKTHSSELKWLHRAMNLLGRWQSLVVNFDDDSLLRRRYIAGNIETIELVIDRISAAAGSALSRAFTTDLLGFSAVALCRAEESISNCS